MRAVVVMCWLVGCGSSPPSVHPSSAPAPTRPAPPDAPAEPVGAVPIPDDSVEYPIRHRDLTVAFAELPTPDAAWPQRATLRYRGRVAIALHIAGHEFLELAVVDTVTETETGYPGTLEDIRLGPADTHEQPIGGNAFPARDLDPETGELVGPVMFAVRLLPRAGAAEAERRQYVVYTANRTIFVADKLVTERAWIPKLRIEAPDATEIVAIHPGWH